MKHFKSVQIIFIAVILSSLSGCMEKTGEIPAVTPIATEKETVAVSTPVIEPTEIKTPVKYLVLFDDYGFNQVLETTYKKKVAYEKSNRTLTINVGDTVEWKNEYDFKLTLVSDQGLWTPGETRAIMTDRVFNYTFNSPGTFTFSIERERVTPLTIIVSP